MAAANWNQDISNFIKTYRALECESCHTVLAYEHRETGALYCANIYGDGGGAAAAQAHADCSLDGASLLEMSTNDSTLTEQSNNRSYNADDEGSPPSKAGSIANVGRKPSNGDVLVAEKKRGVVDGPGRNNLVNGNVVVGEKEGISLLVKRDKNKKRMAEDKLEGPDRDNLVVDMNGNVVVGKREGSGLVVKQKRDKKREDKLEGAGLGQLMNRDPLEIVGKGGDCSGLVVKQMDKKVEEKFEGAAGLGQVVTDMNGNQQRGKKGMNGELVEGATGLPVESGSQAASLGSEQKLEDKTLGIGATTQKRGSTSPAKIRIHIHYNMDNNQCPIHSGIGSGELLPPPQQQHQRKGSSPRSSTRPDSTTTTAVPVRSPRDQQRSSRTMQKMKMMMAAGASLNDAFCMSPPPPGE